MTSHARPLDWKKCDSRLQSLERQLAALLSMPEYSGDDRRLTRVYVRFGGLVKDRLDPSLLGSLALAEQYASTSVFPPELEGVSHQLGSVSRQLASQEAQSGVETDQPFIYKLLESCTCQKFSIDPATDAEPISWMAALDVAADDIAHVVHSVYPELAKG
jgi:hypothetical protein